MLSEDDISPHGTEVYSRLRTVRWRAKYRWTPTPLRAGRQCYSSCPDVLHHSAMLVQATLVNQDGLTVKHATRRPATRGVAVAARRD